ncbi:MAG: TonB-dependent receptor domain-containing protein [Vicinamibacterales bacterium]
MRLQVVTLALALLLATGAASLAHAQAFTAGLAGTVFDSDGGVLPGATVIVTNIDNGQERTVASDQEGRYAVPLLPPGQYRVVAELQGFRRAIREPISLSVNQQQRADFTLGVGAINEEVIVTAELPMVQTNTATVGTVVNQKETSELPLNGRNFLQLNLLVPGALPSTKGTTLATQGGAINVHGLRESSNFFWLDGIDNTTQAIGQLIVNPPTYSIEEFRVMSPTYSAEFGRTAGAQINVITRAGANTFHGDVYEFYRNSAMDAKNVFDPPGEIPLFRRNQYGADVGGRVIRDRTFFFVGFEGLRARQGGTFTGRVPLSEMLNGDFSRLGSVVRDPLTGEPFPGNVIPASRLDAIGRSLAAAYPEPNAADPLRNFVSRPINTLDDDTVIARVDQQLSTSNRLLVRYNFQNIHELQPVNLFARTTIIPGYGREQGATRFITVGVSDTHTFTTNLLGEFRVGFNRWKLDYLQQDRDDDVAGRLGLTGLSRKSIDFGFPLLNMGGVYENLGSATNLPQQGPFDTYSLASTITYVRGAQSIRFGGDYRHFASDFIFDSTARGSYSFTGRYTGNPLADLLLGLPTQAQRGLGRNGDTQFAFISQAFSAFVQDDWRASDRLTLTLGLRYEYVVPTIEGEDRLTNFDFARGQVLVAGQNGATRSMYEPDKTAFAPRIGFSYDINGDGRLAVRGGYGIFYEVPLINQTLNLRLNPPFFSGDLALGDGRSVTLANAFDNLAIVTPNLSAFDQNYKLGRVQQFSFNVQRQLADNLVADVGYVGTRGDRLFRTVNNNQPLPAPGAVQARRPYPMFGAMNTVTSVAESEYNGLEARLERRFSRGHSFLASYTFSKSMDHASGSGGTADSGVPQNNRDLEAEWGPSVFDVRHRFVFSTVYELPIGPGRAWWGNGSSGLAAKLLEGWQANAILTFQGGQPFTPVLAVDNSNTGQFQDRPNVIGDPYEPGPGCLETRTANCWVNPAAFALADAFTFGNAGRNSLRGPGTKNVDVSLVKNTPLAAGRQLQFRAEFFNVFNWVNYDNPNRTALTPNFGRIFSAGPPRQIQLGLRFIF